MKELKSGLAHCCHHDKHWEFCHDYDGRVEYIKTEKPAGEQELRLRLFQLVPDVPGRDSAEWAACEKAGAAYISKYQVELDTLHDKLFPDCTWDGKTIFGKELNK